MGNNAGCLGETCALAILIGGAYLIARRVISPVIPVTYLATAALFSALFGRDPLFDLLSGGLLLGAFFMATDYTTSPLYFWGRVVFAIGCGALTLVIREFGSLPEGVSYSILLMNILTPLIERISSPRPLAPRKKPGRRKGAGSRETGREKHSGPHGHSVRHLRHRGGGPGGHQPADQGPDRPASQEKAEESRRIVLPAAEEFQEEDGYYAGLAGGEAVGYVFETEASGYGGAVS